MKPSSSESWLHRGTCFDGVGFLPAQMIRDELSKVMKKYSEYREGEQAMYKKMLGSTSTSTIQEKQPKSWVSVCSSPFS